MSVICKICNDEFDSLQGLSHHLKSKHNIISNKEKKIYYDNYIKDKNEGKCLTCGKSTNYIGFGPGYRKYCSHSCVFLNKDSLNKYKNTMKEKYGFEHYFQNQETQDKIHQTDGYKNRKCSWSDQNTINKLSEIRKTKIELFEKENNCTQYKKITAKYNSTVWYKLKLPKMILGRDKFIENKYLQTIDNYMKEYNKHKAPTSIAEKQIVTFIKSFYTKEVVENSRKIIKPLELDIYLPDINLAIEYNGTWFHSYNAGTSKNYHINKSKRCRNLGIRLIHIYEFEDFNKQLQLLKDLINGQDNYPKNDYNKNNLLDDFTKVKPYCTTISNLQIYTVGKLL